LMQAQLMMTEYVIQQKLLGVLLHAYKRK